VIRGNLHDHLGEEWTSLNTIPANAFKPVRTVQAEISQLPSLVAARNVRFDAVDGFPICGTLFFNRDAKGPLVLINSATAVARGFYTKFAMACMESGARAALVYDYRGVGESTRPDHWSGRINMMDWGMLDMPAAIRFLQACAPGFPLVGVGHSIGGTMLGLCGKSESFQRFVMVGAALGTLCMTDERLKLFVRMNIIGRPIAALLGKAPKWIGLGTDLPRTVFYDWVRWSSQANYLFDDPEICGDRHFAEVSTPLLSVAVHDDPWATPRAIRAHNAHFPNAPIKRCQVTQNPVENRPIGHFGFFRSRFSRTLWPGVIDWMYAKNQ
jgi:predicted alpha/beta hydrolase